jgi:hypothetical protein
MLRSSYSPASDLSRASPADVQAIYKCVPILLMFSVVHLAHDRLGLESSGFGHPLTASIEFPLTFPC